MSNEVSAQAVNRSGLLRSEDWWAVWLGLFSDVCIYPGRNVYRCVFHGDEGQEIRRRLYRDLLDHHGGDGHRQLCLSGSDAE